jgi:hypothetical protein
MDKVVDAMRWATLHFLNADLANAAIHMAEVRYSPITFALAEALETLSPSDAEMEEIAHVLSHRGNYILDGGR